VIDFCVSGFLIPLLVAILRKALQAFRLKFEDANYVNMKSVSSTGSFKINQLP